MWRGGPERPGRRTCRGARPTCLRQAASGRRMAGEPSTTWTGRCATRAMPPTPARQRISPRPRSSWCLSDSARRHVMRRRGDFSVSVTKDHLVFSSAHFITFAGHRCEGLHGHNYRARVTVDGKLDDEAWFVFDFVILKRIMKKLCDEIDHKVLLPLENPKIQVVEEGESVTVAYEGKPRYVFPRIDCALLP